MTEGSKTCLSCISDGYEMRDHYCTKGKMCVKERRMNVVDLDDKLAHQHLQFPTDAKSAGTETQSKEEPAMRLDAGKVRYDLVPADSFHELAKVFTKGAEKYAERNWEKGMTWGRTFRAMMSHAWKWWRGETFDDGPGGTGCHHMAIVAWNALVLCSYDFRQIGTDDRVVLKDSPAWLNRDPLANIPVAQA